MRATKTVVGAQGVYDGANRVYSDSNPPETLVMTDFAAGGVATPAAGRAVLFTPNGSILMMKDDSGVVRSVGPSLTVLPFSKSGVLTVSAGTHRFPIVGATYEVDSVGAMVGTAPTGASLIVDVNKNGTSIYGTQANRPTIAAAANAATVGAHTATSLAVGDYLTVDVDQIGSTVAGSDLTVVVNLRRTG